MNKKYKIKEHKDEIITHIIKNLIWIPIASIIPIVWNLLEILYKNFFENSKYNWELFLSITTLILSLLTIIISIFMLIKEKKNGTCESLNEPEIIYNYKFESVNAEMIFQSREEITSTIEYKMIVLADEVNELSRELIWSGSSYKGTKLIQKNGDYDLIDSQRKSSPYKYTIVLNDAKTRGERIELKTETTVIDGNLDMSPVYSFMVKYQIDTLKLCVIAPKDIIKNVKSAIYADRAREIPVSNPKFIKCENVGNLRKYVYEIKNPILLYNYFIEWEFTNQK